MVKNKKITFITIIFILLLIVGGIFLIAHNNKNKIGPYDIELKINNSKIELSYKGPDNVYVLVNEENNCDNNEWTLINNHQALFEIVDYKEYFFLKYRNNIYEVGSNEDLCEVDFHLLNNDKQYLAIEEEFNYEYELNIKGYTNETIKWLSEDENIVSIADGKAIAKSVGETKITAYILNKSAIREIVVSDLIIKAPTSFDEDKELLPCGIYDEKQNDLIDEILENRISEVGLKSRAGVVEAARFLTLNFPYKINYFYEWGRQDLDKIDGEGRYYLKGLYLDESRFNNLIGSNKKPQTWGCLLYSPNVNSYALNGLDCSGFVTWALLNGGYDPGDIGSGFSKYTKSLTDIGDIKKINDEVLKETKVGDLVHSDYTGGHIGIIIGKDNENYYIAEATPKDDVEALVVTTLNKDELKKQWDEIILMDNYYLDDGKLSNMWY